MTKATSKLRTQHIPLKMTEDELRALDDWRAERRIWNRSEAIRQLISAGLSQYTAPLPSQPMTKE